MFYSPLVKKASLLAFEAHKNDYDKGGYPYVMHPFYLAFQMEDEQGYGALPKTGKVWRCLSRVENGTTYCKDSITVEEDLLQQTVCLALRKAIQFDREVYDLIFSNLSYGVTGVDDSLDIFAIETQIKELKNRIEENVDLAVNTEGDPQKYYDVIKYINSQILALNEQLNLEKEKLSSEERTSMEIARIKECLDDATIFDKYDDRTLRRLVDHIRVMGDKRLIIVLKGGLQIEEKIYNIRYY